MQPKSLLTICMRTLQKNHRYINMTILPIELAERLNKFIKMDSDNTINNKYNDYIMMQSNTLITACDALSPIQINPLCSKIYDTTVINNDKFIYVYYVLYPSHYDSLIFGNEYLNNIAKLFSGDSAGLIIIDIKKINPILLQYLFERKLCIYCPDIPSIDVLDNF